MRRKGWSRRKEVGEGRTANAKAKKRKRINKGIPKRRSKGNPNPNLSPNLKNPNPIWIPKPNNQIHCLPKKEDRKSNLDLLQIFFFLFSASIFLSSPYLLFLFSFWLKILLLHCFRFFLLLLLFFSYFPFC